MQDIPVLSVQSYFHLNVKRSSLFHFILIKALPSLFNTAPLLVFIPFAIRAFPEYYSDSLMLPWLLSLFFIMLNLNYVVFYIKKQIALKPWTNFVFIGIISGLVLLEKYNLVNVTGASLQIFGSFITEPTNVILPFISLIILYYLNFRYLRSKMYPEEMNLAKERKSLFSGDISFLKRFDQLGNLIILEIKMLIRHKRTRGVLVMAPLFVLYGLFFYPNDIYEGFSGILLFIGVMISGMFVLSYGQFMSGWEGSHFDRLLSERISVHNYYYAKLWLFWPICTLMYILSIPYFVFSWKIVFINLMALTWSFEILLISPMK